ncbi:putative urease accessory protein UreF-like [Cladobotryum mycophilum]|uniref:Urease accessory protein UreF-like n=1 Tax=Cladobotryum mycophilum TaxID=491253 RepID=A0ABR0SN74_9HYPO
MLGWMLGRGENALDAIDDGDTTQIEQPDTPAPVFAARAFKSALFGTPAPRADSPSRSRAKSNAESVVSTIERDMGTPMKPQGILLTPGTGTNRRKRVSFNHEALTTTKSISPNDNGKESGGKRTRLSEALEKARRKGSGTGSKKTDAPSNKETSDSEWEEEEDDNFCTNDITLDLNEPHSQSGKYWKGEFERYRKEAGAEMEKLIKYKQRAKSYAREKDVEALQLADKLKEEQEKVIAMEKKIAENAGQMAAKQRDSCGSESAEFLATLTKQTAMAAQYRHRVQELEEQLEDLIQGREQDGEPKGKKRRTAVPSPTTQRTLLDTQRELRRARTQLKELDALREQVSSLKSQLKQASRRNSFDVVDSDKSESSRIQELKAQLKQVKGESAKKDEEILQLKGDFETFRKESEAHDADSKAVLERAHTKISDLKKEIRSLKTTNSTELTRPRSWHPKSENDQLTKDDLSMELPSKRAVIPGIGRRSIDLAELDRPDMLNLKPRTLREKYREDATGNQMDAATPKPVPNILTDRPNLEKPRWQPFVPRSPRNRAYLDEGVTRRIQNGATTSTTKLKDITVPDLPALAKSIARSKRSGSVERGEVEVDLLQDRFARLGGPDGNQERGKGTVVLSTSARSSLPPDRRAAALARIEKRMAEKRAQRRDGYDKENLVLKVREDEIKDEIEVLEQRLQAARARLRASSPSTMDIVVDPPLLHTLPPPPRRLRPPHRLLRLQQRPRVLRSAQQTLQLLHLPPLSLSSFASTTLPFVLAAHRDPASLPDLDDQLDAAVVCTVGRRASVAQGRALLSIWERSFRHTLPLRERDAHTLREFSALLKRESKADVPLASAHLGPLFGAICSIVGLSLHQTAYVFMLSHVKALVSAAVRANMFGPYQAQKLLASDNVQHMINAVVEREWETPIEEAGQSVPVMDLWIGRHETLYSRIFNS